MLLEWEQVRGIGKGFQLQEISFALPEGYIMGLAGANGAGKTTLINYMMNPKKQYEGMIRLLGEDIHADHRKMMNRIGFVSEENLFFKDVTVQEHATMLSEFYENWDMPYFQETMKQVKIPLSRKVGNLSRGENMKFQMAFAMAHHPSLYLLDEVTAGMDPVFRIDFFKLLQKVISEEQVSVLMTSHIQSEMERKMDYIGILEHGRLKSFGEAI